MEDKEKSARPLAHDKEDGQSKMVKENVGNHDSFLMMLHHQSPMGQVP
jgi:hypothetical protein